MSGLVHLITPSSLKEMFCTCGGGLLPLAGMVDVFILSKTDEALVWLYDYVILVWWCLSRATSEFSHRLLQMKTLELLWAFVLFWINTLREH